MTAGARDLSAAEARELREAVARWLTEGPRCACGHNWLAHHGADAEDGCMGLPLWGCPCPLIAAEVTRGVDQDA